MAKACVKALVKVLAKAFAKSKTKTLLNTSTVTRVHGWDGWLDGGHPMGFSVTTRIPSVVDGVVRAYEKPVPGDDRGRDGSTTLRLWYTKHLGRWRRRLTRL